MVGRAWLISLTTGNAVFTFHVNHFQITHISEACAYESMSLVLSMKDQGLYPLTSLTSDSESVIICSSVFEYKPHCSNAGACVISLNRQMCIGMMANADRICSVFHKVYFGVTAVLPCLELIIQSFSIENFRHTFFNP